MKIILKGQEVPCPAAGLEPKAIGPNTEAVIKRILSSRKLEVQDYPKYQKRLKRICGAALLILDDFLLHTIFIDTPRG